MARRSLAGLVFLVLVAGVSVLSLLSCGGGGGGGSSTKPGDEVIITPPGENRAPVIERTFEDITLTLEAGRTVQWQSAAIHTYFSDPDTDALEYRATSYNSRVAHIDFSDPGPTLTVRAVGTGTARVTLMATDPGGLSVTQSFTVTVNDGTVLPPDDSDTIAGAADIGSGDTVERYLDSPNDVDIFRIRITDTRLIDVTLTSEESGMEVALLDDAGNVLDSAVTASDARLRATARGGDLFLRVRAVGPDLLRKLAQEGAEAFNLAVTLGRNIQSAINVLEGGGGEFNLEIGGTGLRLALGDHFDFPAGSTGRAFEFSLSAGNVTATLERGVLRISDAHGATPGPVRLTVTARAFGLSPAFKLFQVNLADAPNQPPQSVCDATVQTTVNPGEKATFPLDACFKDDKPDELSFDIARVVESNGVGWQGDIFLRDLEVDSSSSMSSRDFITVEVTATDSSGQSAKQAFRVNLNKALHPVRTQVPTINLDPGGSKTIDLTRYFQDPEGFGLTFALGQVPQGLTARLAGNSLTLSADSQAAGGYDFPVTVTTADGRSKVFDFRVNVKAPLRALKDLVIRVMAGQMTTVRLADFIGFPQGVTDPPRLSFVLQPGTDVGQLGATMDAASANLTINPPAGLQDEFTLRVKAVVVDARFESTDFSFRVIVGEEAVPRKIEGGPPLLVSAEQGGEAMIRLTDHIEDPGGGQLTFAHASLPTDFGVTQNGPDWTIRVPLEAELGEYVISVTATNQNGMSADFALRIVVEEASAVVEPPFRIGEPPSDVQSCLATTGNSLQRLYDNLAQIGTTTLVVCGLAYCPANAVGADAVKCSCCQTVEDYIQANPARDVYIDRFVFECTVEDPHPDVLPLSVTGLVPRAYFSIATREGQNECRMTVDNRRAECRQELKSDVAGSRPFRATIRKLSTNFQ